MTSNEVFDSQVNSDGSLAGVYEYEDDVGYFYLYDLARPEGQKIIGAIRVLVGSVHYALKDLSIRWSDGDVFVGLFIENRLCAAFKVDSCEAFGGEFEKNSLIPESIKNSFRRH